MVKRGQISNMITLMSMKNGLNTISVGFICLAHMGFCIP